MSKRLHIPPIAHLSLEVAQEIAACLLVRTPTPVRISTPGSLLHVDPTVVGPSECPTLACPVARDSIPRSKISRDARMWEAQVRQMNGNVQTVATTIAISISRRTGGLLSYHYNSTKIPAQEPPR